LRICCAQCDKRSKSTSESYRRLEIKQDGIRYNKSNSKVYNQVRQQKNRRKEKQFKYIKQYNKQFIPAMQTKMGLPKISSMGRYGMVSYEINLRAILSAYMIGTGGFDICRVMTMMGISGGPVFERQFYKCSAYIHHKIIEVCAKVVRDALDEEIELSSSTKTKINSSNHTTNTIDDDEVNENTNELTSTAAPIDVAFDMGWQKRAGGRVYDSLSGHGFLIGQKRVR
jgi:hypothetical protein